MSSDESANGRGPVVSAQGGARYLATRLRPHGLIFVLAVLASCCALVCELALPWIVATIIDHALAAKDRELLASYTRWLAAGAAAMVLFWVLEKILFARIGGQVLLQIHRDLLRKAHSLPLRSHLEARSGEVTALFTGDAVSCSEFYEYDLSELILSVIQALSTLVVLFLCLPDLALPLILTVPLYLVFTIPLGRPIRRASRTFREGIAEVGGLVQESLSAIREIKVFNRQEWNLERLSGAFGQLTASRLRLRALKEAFNINVIAFWVVVSCVYWFGGLKVMRGEMTLGMLVAALSYCRILQQPFIRLVDLFSQIQAVFGSADRIVGFLRSSPPSPLVKPRRRLSPGPGRLEIENLCFGYEPGKVILDDISVVVEAGQSLAVVGPSGSGKSTLLRLLLGLYRPTGGRICIDGQEIGEVSVESFRDNVAAVFEETVLFSTSILENIRFGNLDAGDDEVIAAAKAADCHEFVLSLEKGYETEVGERGVKLSNGQKQRLSIARAILRNPRILLLDEATSALDAESEAAVLRALAGLVRGRTAIIVSHRLWNLPQIKTIMALERGRQVDLGTHSQLLTRCRLYQRLWSLQGLAPKAVSEAD